MWDLQRPSQIGGRQHRPGGSRGSAPFLVPTDLHSAAEPFAAMRGLSMHDMIRSITFGDLFAGSAGALGATPGALPGGPRPRRLVGEGGFAAVMVASGVHDHFAAAPFQFGRVLLLEPDSPSSTTADGTSSTLVSAFENSVVAAERRKWAQSKQWAQSKMRTHLRQPTRP